MARVNKNSHRLDADYTEDTVGLAIESFLALISFPRFRFSIEPFSRARERSLGADAKLAARIAGFRPFYMQFKRPSGYPDHSTSKVVADRKRLKLDTFPRSLYFPLREKRPTHADYQQNILYRLRERLRQRGIGDAAYVCPLFLERSAYRFHLHIAGLSRWLRPWHRCPWDLEDLLVEVESRTIRFDRLPVLAEHITIPPHDKVTTAKHNYSFTEAGKAVCFHSPQEVPDGAVSLAIFLKQLSANFLNGGERITNENSASELQSLIGLALPDRIPSEFQSLQSDQFPLRQWLAWGDHLREQYEIEQFAMVSWSEPE